MVRLAARVVARPQRSALTEPPVLTVLVLGLLVGMRHALEADHIAAVTSLASRSASLADRIKVAAAWGGGHALSLMILGGVLVALGTTLPERAARGFEIAAGCMLIALGIDVLRRLRRRHIHFHVHQHADGARHLHAHAHQPETHHDAAAAHDHQHVRGVLPRALAVGGIHGLAGSGALVLLSMQMLGSGVFAVAYVICFAFGSIVGMVAFSLALALPFTLTPGLLERFAGRLEAVLGIATISLGCWMAVQAAAF
jgi:ABC-type nickel/cobalt efflux system permease component RcnA